MSTIKAFTIHNKKITKIRKLPEIFSQEQSVIPGNSHQRLCCYKFCRNATTHALAGFGGKRSPGKGRERGGQKKG